MLIIFNATFQLNQGQPKQTSVQTLSASKSFLIIQVGSSWLFSLSRNTAGKEKEGLRQKCLKFNNFSVTEPAC